MIVRLGLAFLVVIVLVLRGKSAEFPSSVNTFWAPSAQNDVTELFIESSLDGSIKWYTGAYSNLHVKVNKTAGTESDIDNIRVETVRNDTDRFHLKLDYISSPSTEPTSPTSPPTDSGSFLIVSRSILVVFALIGVFFNRGKLELLTVLIVIACCFSFVPQIFTAQAVDTPRADITVYLPKDLKLKVVSLKSEKGSIRVDENLFETSGDELECLSGEILQECPSCCSGHGECINGVCQCISSFNGTECDYQTDVAFKLYTNPSDPTIAVAVTPDGEEIYAIGNKTSEGLPETIDEFRLVDSEGQTITKLNEKGEIESAIDSDGQKWDITWTDSSNLFISIVLPNATQQYTLNINLTDPTILDENNNAKRNAPAFADDKRPLRRKPTVERQQPEVKSSEENGKRKEVQKRNSDSTQDVAIKVTVTSCDEVVDDALVTVDALIDYDEAKGTSSSQESYPAYYNDYIEQYCAAIPTEPSELDEQIGEICEGILSGIDKMCEIYGDLGKITDVLFNKEPDSVICVAVTLALKAIPAVPKTLPIHKFCKKIFKGVKTFCKVNDNVGKVVSDEVVCDLVTGIVDNFIDLFDGEKKIQLTPRVQFAKGNTVEGQSQVVQLSAGSTTTFSVSDDITGPKIINYFSSPYDPVPYQDYIATVMYECYTGNTHVTMTIVGTDGYSDSTSCSNGPVCQLHVPGAVELVVDTVTVTITDPSTTDVETRTIYIIF